MPTRVKSLRGDNERKRLQARRSLKPGQLGAERPRPGPRQPESSPCGPRQDARPSRSRRRGRRAPPGLTLPVHSFCTWGCRTPALQGGQKGDSGAERPWWATTPAQSPGHAAIPARQRPPREGGLRPRRPAPARASPRPEPRSPAAWQPHPPLGRGPGLPARGAASGKPGSPPPGCPAAAGSLPSAPSPAPDFPRRGGQTLSALPWASQLGPRAGGSQGPHATPRRRSPAE